MPDILTSEPKIKKIHYFKNFTKKKKYTINFAKDIAFYNINNAYFFNFLVRMIHV